MFSKPSTGLDTDQSDKAPYPAQQSLDLTEFKPDIEPVFDHKAQGLEETLFDSTSGANLSQSGGSQNTVAGEPPKRADDVHSATSSTGGRLDAETITHEGLRTGGPLTGRSVVSRPAQEQYKINSPLTI